MHNPGNGGQFDLLPEIVEIVRDAIADGLLAVDLDTFNYRVRTMHGYELEEYIQACWDKI